ncbi:MAG: acyloxyacyl hydrolase [Bacteroidaceae bacterium]
MEIKRQMWKHNIFWVILFFFSSVTFAEGQTFHKTQDNQQDSASLSQHFTQRLGIEIRPGYIFQTNPFLEGDNLYSKPIKNSFSYHLKYSFQLSPNTAAGRIFGGAYQGIGLACYSFGDKEEMGKPLAIYLFQGARITRLSSLASLNYEWNLGISCGWKPYDYDTNYYNKIIGSKVNAYINMNFYLNWTLSRHFDLTSGIAFTHFSNGNTKYPNAGLNTANLKVGLVYKFNEEEKGKRYCPKPFYHIPPFPRHISYDLVLFGSWRRKGVYVGDSQVLSPNAYTVLGFNFAPMYNLGYRFRLGASLDGVYDGSANAYAEDNLGDIPEFRTPPLQRQLALGLSGRAEYVMPYFSINLGVGVNMFHGGGDLKALYQTLALKIKMTRNSFIHIGYNLKDFHDPNFLMLGIGFRFNNKYPRLHY